MATAVSLDPSYLANPRPSSPIKRNACSTTAANAPLHDRRQALLVDLDQVVPIVGIQYFQDFILPPLPCNSRAIKRTISSLRRKEVITGGRWKYWDKDPRDLNGVDPAHGGRLLEDAVFSAFETLSDDVKESFIAIGGPQASQDGQVEFRCNPSCVPVSQNRRESSLSRPDAYALLSDYISPIQWSDVVIPGEFKKNDIATDKLDDHEIVVDFFLRVTFSKRSDLGYDETMVRLPALSPLDKSVVYEIEVRDPTQTPVVKKYRTRRLISELGAISPRGRGTRVWEVDELDAGGNAVGTTTKVVKDTWGDEDRPIEGEIVAKIRDKAIAAGQGEDFKKYFMSTSRYGHVYVGEGDDARPDSTASFRLSRLDSPKIPINVPTLRIAVNPGHRAHVMTRQGPVATDADVQAQIPVEYSRYSAKVHHRIVYDEVGTPIFRAQSLRRAFQCIGHVLRGLDLMHRLGWVHRDISYGNILIVGKRGKITDLEYAKEDTDMSTHGIRTGTVYFMSREVDSHRYLHLAYKAATNGQVFALEQVDNDIEYNSESDCDSDAEDDEPTEAEHPPTPVAKPTVDSPAAAIPFRHNPLHDLESVVWLCFYLLLAATFKKEKVVGYTHKAVAAFAAHQDEVFRHVFTRQEMRLHIMNLNAKVDDIFSGLHPTVKEVAGHLLAMRAPLVEGFIAAEATMSAENPIPFTAGSRAVAEMGRHVFDIVNQLLSRKDLKILTEDDFRPQRPVWKQITPKAKPRLLPSPTADASTPQGANADPTAVNEVQDHGLASVHDQAGAIARPNTRSASSTLRRTTRSQSKKAQSSQATATGDDAGISSSIQESQPNTKGKGKAPHRTTRSQTANNADGNKTTETAVKKAKFRGGASPVEKATRSSRRGRNL
ncbi:uncharacterized protein PHACADRAFT_145449 [Phanerochaete carnosa HHB-10118-sp]|uniref:Fungal-type protein kinase domain-containing protein n=1 Tax=Phanerochaete carnosa (strain HHB-10118-sp) TaxID=650164 RepID=K5W471_PHACS|nr:uncharacterized protein PHACADRAFT_145449 [Phanerochaete carnosa HHB-10118-sp]EKM53935.1 hypothetical protein PHACADRAFT_145449 [Phanerochaete carnosa HHB-10118-sp]